jgi:predicted dehydrogenase
MNAGIHWANFFVNLTGIEPLDYVIAICEASTRTYRDGMQVETTAVTYAQTNSGIRFVMNTGDDVLQDPDVKNGMPFRVVGTAGQIVFGSWSPTYFIQNAANPQGTMVDAGNYPEGGHQRHLEAMAAMIGKGAPDYSIPDSSMMALELVEGAYISSRHRCKVTFPVDTFVPPPPVDWNPGLPYSGQGGGRDGRKL